ncbi:MAG: hypothetical protein Q9163_001839 [Psora crenata]
MTATYTQHHLTLPSLWRGSHLITDHITSSLPEIRTVRCGLLHLFLQHTSAALTLNENYDPEVRADMSDSLDRIVVEDKGMVGLLTHLLWGGGGGVLFVGRQAHIKSSMIGASVSIPISQGKLALGAWQGIWFLEFRDGKQKRKVVATIQGEKS